MSDAVPPRGAGGGSWWRRLWRPSVRWSVGSLVIVGLAVGLIIWGGFTTTLEMTNTLAFCANTCHEMTDNVYAEYKETIHYTNRTGVRAICSDCHVPKDYVHKVIRKAKATGELWGHFTGKIDTKEKFEAHRMVLAQNEWRQMKETDSRECRNCHSFEAMAKTKQRPRAQKNHATATARGKTCIDCHKGIAHLLPAEYDEAADEANLDTTPAPPSTAPPTAPKAEGTAPPASQTEEKARTSSAPMDSPKR
jgi:cytochrome c-type protein NapC